MASQPLQPPITARLDGSGRLVAADAPLLTLHEQAGASLGLPLAVPQLAAIARLAARLGVTISRTAIAASETEDIELEVRAEPDDEGVTLIIGRWTARPPVRPRWAAQAVRSEDLAEGEQRLSTDRDLRIAGISPTLARRFGMKPEEVAERPLVGILRPMEDDDGNLSLVAALAGRSPFEDQPVLVRGTEQICLARGLPRFDDGRFEGFDIVLYDAGKEQPLAGVPLDDLLKEPLSSIIDQAQEIAARSEGPLKSDYAGYGSDIAAAARHLLDLLASLHAGDESKAEPLAGETIDLAELVLDAAGLVQPQAAERGVVLDIGGVPRLAARGQARAVTQILLNLMGNAVRFSPSGGEVVITLTGGTGGTGASVTVSDSGPGVALQDRVRIFERFEQAGPKPGNAGLGLAISRRLAREMGGDVELLDTAAGATFRLSLPSA